jgi:hypothetical protein
MCCIFSEHYSTYINIPDSEMVRGHATSRMFGPITAVKLCISEAEPDVTPIITFMRDSH